MPVATPDSSGVPIPDRTPDPIGNAMAEAAATTTVDIETLRPTNEAKVAEALADAAQSGRSVAARGGATRAADLPNAAPDPPDALLDLSALAGVITHWREDLTVEVRAGTTVGALNRELAPHRQFLPLDPPFPDRATLGGVVAVGEPGIRRPPGARARDLVLGLGAALSDGTTIRSGGRVVKNVTGYELTKLFTGSFGTLGVITRMALRLAALPEAARTWVFALPAEDPAERFAARILEGLALAGQPEAAALLPPGTGLAGMPEGGGFRLALRFEGLREEADRPVSHLAEVLGSPPEEVRGGAAEQLWGGVRDFLPAVPRRKRTESGEDWFGVAARGGRAATLRTAWRWAEFGPALAFPDLNRALAALPGAALPNALEAASREPGVVVSLESVPASWPRPGTEPEAEKARQVFFSEPPAPARALMRRLRQGLDPAGALPPGPFRWLREPPA